MKLESIATFGKKFIVEPAGTSLTADEKRILRELRPAGVMFRKRNFLQDQNYATWLAAYRELIRQCREAIGREKIILCIDHEGGRVIRPPLPITPFPYAAKWADEVVPVAQAMAIELKSLGINVNFAPVADIHSNPDNPVINERAFGRTAKEVIEAASKFADTMLEYGIFPCAKHFPGHGDTKQDSHYALPTVNSTLTQLRQRELLPFQALIDRDIPLVMTAHILLPEIDPENQATISKKILTDLLRNEMGFKGVAIADALGMNAVSDIIEEQNTIATALQAGLDLFLVAGDSVDLGSAFRIAKQMQTVVMNGSVTEKTLAESFQRIDKLLDRLPQHQIEELDQNIFNQHAALAAKLAEHKAWSNFDLHVPGFE